jgi:prepilin-type processing-associated H-X9-DG protein
MARESTPRNEHQGIDQGTNARRGRRCTAFTLTELLAVVTVLTLLTSVLLPGMQQAARYARAAACQGNLHQWSLAFAMFAEENERGVLCTVNEWGPFCWRYADGPRRSLLLCPMATRYRLPPCTSRAEDLDSIGYGLGSKFTAWRLPSRNMGTEEPGPMLGSYGTNGLGLAFLDPRLTRFGETRPSHSSVVPLMVDCISWYPYPKPTNDPPAYEGEATTPGMKEICINRHDGGINSLFLDGSGQKVGLKELWTLRWSPEFDTHSPWTKAGGIQPEDWPPWMRGFRDY